MYVESCAFLSTDERERFAELCPCATLDAADCFFVDESPKLHYDDCEPTYRWLLLPLLLAVS